METLKIIAFLRQQKERIDLAINTLEGLQDLGNLEDTPRGGNPPKLASTQPKLLERRSGLSRPRGRPIGSKNKPKILPANSFEAYAFEKSPFTGEGEVDGSS